jgi:excisionase family DNA binding protein
MWAILRQRIDERLRVQIQWVRTGETAAVRRAKGAGVEADRTEYQDVIDEALRVVYSHHHRIVTRLFPDAERPLNIEALRQGPLGRDLSRLAKLARGEAREPKDRVLEAIDTVLQLLFWPPMAEDYSVPRSFWETSLGRMMSMAKYRAYEPAELVSIGTAAQRLGVTRPTIYRWMDERHLGYVRDDMSGRTFVVQRDVESLLQESQDSFSAIG